MFKSLVLVLALSAVAVQAAPKHTIDVVDKEKLTLFKTLVDISGATKAFSNEKARVTVLAPTNAAIEAFLKEMGLTAADLKKNEALADAIVAYHTVLGVTAGPKELFAKSSSVKVPTASSPYSVIFTKTADGVTVTDFQGNVAKVSKADLGMGNARVHVIDKVLFSGAYWPTLAKLIKTLPGQFSTLGAAAEAAGLTSTLSEGFTDTLFLPTNKAFEASGIKLADAPATRVADILAYHIVKGDHTIPTGFESGKPVTTEEGQDITVTYEQGAKITETMAAGSAYVTDATGKKVKVVHPNLFINKADAHVIDGVLMPKTEEAPAAATTAEVTPAAEATTVAVAPSANPSAPPTTTSSSSSTSSITDVHTAKVQAIINFVAGLLGPKDTVTVKLTFPEHPMMGKGRKLMQAGGDGASTYAESIALDSTEQSILSAVNSVSAGGSAAGAAAAGTDNTLLETSYPVDATYADGISQAGYGAGGN